MTVFGFLPGLGPAESIILLVIGILIFGKKLPEVGKQVAKTFFELKRSLQGVQDDLLTHGELDLNKLPQRTASTTAVTPRVPQRVTATAPKFTEEPEPAAPAAAPPPVAPPTPADVT